MKIAVDMVKEKLIDEKTAVLASIPPASISFCIQRSIPTPRATSSPRAFPPRRAQRSASPPSPPTKLHERAQAGEKVLLIRKETSPEDVQGMHSAVGILTSTGGMTSHAAVVARGWGKCCIVGAGAMQIDEKAAG